MMASDADATAADVTASQLDAMSISNSHDPSPQPPRRDGEPASTSTSAYLTPLQQSLVFELTTRRARIAAAQQRVDFWRAHEDGEAGVASGASHQFGRDIVDAAYLDDLIRQRKAKLAKAQQAQKLKEAIVASADAAHAINASMAAIPPAPFSTSSDTPLCIHDGPLHEQPLRSLTARRDQLALQFLGLHEQVKELRAKRREATREIDAIRQQTSSLARQVREAKASLEVQREADASVDVSQQDGERQSRVQELQEAITSARGKREMVKGVLRGVILESGLDWYGNRKLRTLVMSLADEDLNSSDEEINLFSDEEKEEESKEEDDYESEEEGDTRDMADDTGSRSPIVIDSSVDSDDG